MLTSNSVALKGAYLKSIEVDYEITGAAATSVTAAVNKVTRGADTAVAVVTSIPCTQDLAAGVAAATQAKHKLTVTVTTPVWCLNTEYLLLVLTIVASTAVIELEGATVNYTFRA